MGLLGRATCNSCGYSKQIVITKEVVPRSAEKEARLLEHAAGRGDSTARSNRAPRGLQDSQHARLNCRPNSANCCAERERCRCRPCEAARRNPGQQQSIPVVTTAERAFTRQIAFWRTLYLPDSDNSVTRSVCARCGSLRDGPQPAPRTIATRASGARQACPEAPSARWAGRRTGRDSPVDRS